LDDFVACFQPGKPIEQRIPTWSAENPTGRWRAYSYTELITRDKANLDLFWLRDESLEESANLPEPEIIAAEIMEDLEDVLALFREITRDLQIPVT
jgi:type I restriction enzyme M protein